LLVFHRLAIFERAKAFAFDATEMTEDILALGIQNKPKSLFGIEPLDGAD
jgi:hypothetical protein